MIIQLQKQIEAQDSYSSKKIELVNEKIAYIEQNAPNPSNQNTLIKYFLPLNTSNAQIRFTDMNGRVLKSVQLQQNGHGTISISVKELLTGTYFYSLIIDERIVDTKKMVKKDY